MNAKRNKRIKLSLIIAISLLVILFGAFLIYAADYYKEVDVLEYSNNSENVVVTYQKDYWLFKAKDSNTALIFYPGGKVSPKAYFPLAREFADNGITFVLYSMPFNLAILDINKANSFINDEKINIYEDLYIGGHSLGGVCASEYAYNHQDRLKGVLLLGAYTTKNFQNSNLKFISIYGELDGVMNKEVYQENLSNLPSNYEEFIIKGGNHSNFGSYGLQDKDKEPLIANTEQITYTLELFMEAIK